MAIRYEKLTKAGIKALEMGKSLNEHGIIATKLKDGDVRWSVNTMVDGRRIHHSIGRESEGVGRKQCELAVESFRTKAREGRLDLPSGRKTHQTFKEAAQAYIKRLTDTGGKNMKSKRQQIDQLLTPFFGVQRLDRISTLMIQDYVAKRLTTGVKQSTVNRELATLSHLFRRAVRWGWLKTEDIPELERGSEERKHIVVLSEEDSTKLVAAAVADQDPHLWLFAVCGLNTAMRHREILAIRFEDISFETHRIRLPKAKAGEREQPITPSLAAILRNEHEAVGTGVEYVFPPHVRSKYPHRMSMAKPFLRAVSRAGLSPSKVTPHVMRHTAITRLVKAGIDLPTIQRISGHKTLAMVLRYVHIHGDHIDKAIATIDSAFPSLITPELHTGPKSRLASSGPFEKKPIQRVA